MTRRSPTPTSTYRRRSPSSATGSTPSTPASARPSGPDDDVPGRPGAPLGRTRTRDASRPLSRRSQRYLALRLRGSPLAFVEDTDSHSCLCRRARPDVRPGRVRRRETADQIQRCRSGCRQGCDAEGRRPWSPLGRAARRSPTSHPTRDCSFKRSDLVLTGAAKSEFKLEAAGASITSESNILQTRAMVGAEWRRSVGNSSYMACARKVVMNADDPKVKFVSFKKIAFPKLAQYSTRYRMVADYGDAGNAVQCTRRRHRARAETGRRSHSSSRWRTQTGRRRISSSRPWRNCLSSGSRRKSRAYSSPESWSIHHSVNSLQRPSSLSLITQRLLYDHLRPAVGRRAGR